MADINQLISLGIGSPAGLQEFLTYGLQQAAGGSDTTPDAFSFTDQTDVARSSLRTSAPVTITGIDAPVTANATDGLIDVNEDGDFQASREVINGDDIRAQHDASDSYSTATNTLVDINGVSDTFTSTTLASATVPDVDDPGTAEATAIAAIEGEGLVASVARAYSPTIPEGEVISQDPAATTVVAEGSTVTITISRGVVPASTSAAHINGMFGVGRMMGN